MTGIELKTLLINRILELNDEAFLNAIKTILDSKSQSEIMVLTDHQRLELIESKKQIEQGLFFDQEDIDHAFEKWQNEK